MLGAPVEATDVVIPDSRTDFFLKSSEELRKGNLIVLSTSRCGSMGEREPDNSVGVSRYNIFGKLNLGISCFFEGSIGVIPFGKQFLIVSFDIGKFVCELNIISLNVINDVGCNDGSRNIAIIIVVINGTSITKSKLVGSLQELIDV